MSAHPHSHALKGPNHKDRYLEVFGEDGTERSAKRFEPCVDQGDVTLFRAIPLTIASLAPSPAQINNRSLHRSVFLASSPIHNIRQQEVNAALREASDGDSRGQKVLLPHAAAALVGPSGGITGPLDF